jgi:phosphatidylethanolamine/phosphatidyl-N-methylethanolamine N-methyltransferase
MKNCGFWLFFREWLKSPASLGRCFPSACIVGNYITSLLDPSMHVVELGPGTGNLSKLMMQKLEKGHFCCVENNQKLCYYLLQKFPEIYVILGDARNLDTLLPQNWIGNINMILSSLPLSYIPSAEREFIINTALSVLKDDGILYHISSSFDSPIRTLKHISQTRKKILWYGIFPVSVWEYKLK